jgi:hypothetical protein
MALPCYRRPRLEAGTAHWQGTSQPSLWGWEDAQNPQLDVRLLALQLFDDGLHAAGDRK